MGLPQQKSGDDQQNGPIGHQLQKADPVQKLQKASGEFVSVKFSFFLCIPLRKPGGEVKDNAQLGSLGGLPPGQGTNCPDPAVCAAAAGADTGDLHQYQKDDRTSQSQH